MSFGDTSGMTLANSSALSVGRGSGCRADVEQVGCDGSQVDVPVIAGRWILIV